MDGAVDPPISPQRLLSAACEEDLDRYGDSCHGVGYTGSPRQAESRYAVMLGLVRERQEPVTLLDFGCGLAHMLDYLERQADSGHIRYAGLDISARYLDAARSRHPEADLICMDVLESDAGLPDYDYITLNGLFNYRGSLDQTTMLEYWERLLAVVWRHCRRGLAFNAMSVLVDWQRRDLFHLSFDTMARVVGTRLSRHFVVRHDYEAREYTTYVYRTASGE